MLRQEKEKINLETLNSLVNDILDTIKDNNQNMRDCIKLLKQIQNNISPEKPGFLARLKKLFR